MSHMKNDMELNEKAVVPKDKGGDGEKSGGQKHKSPRKGWRWTTVDTIILLMVLFAIGGIVARSLMQHRAAGAQSAPETYFVSMSITEIYEDALVGFKAGDALYLYEDDTLVGFVGQYENGERAIYDMAAVADKKDCATAKVIFFTQDATQRDGALLLEEAGIYLVPGAVLTMRTDTAVFEVRILEIRK